MEHSNIKLTHALKFELFSRVYGAYRTPWKSLHMTVIGMGMKPEIERVTPTEETTARNLLEHKGIRATQQRLALCAVLFRNGQRHLTAEELHSEARRANVRVSVATVYNTLNHFAEASLIRRVSVGGQRIYFDTYAGDHQHFYIEAEDRILDIPEGSVAIGPTPPPPPGYHVSKIDVVVHLERTRDATCDEESR